MNLSDIIVLLQILTTKNGLFNTMRNKGDKNCVRKKEVRRTRTPAPLVESSDLHWLFFQGRVHVSRKAYTMLFLKNRDYAKPCERSGRCPPLRCLEIHIAWVRPPPYRHAETGKRKSKASVSCLPSVWDATFLLLLIAVSCVFVVFCVLCR